MRLNQDALYSILRRFADQQAEMDEEAEYLRERERERREIEREREQEESENL